MLHRIDRTQVFTPDQLIERRQGRWKLWHADLLTPDNRNEGTHPPGVRRIPEPQLPLERRHARIHLPSRGPMRLGRPIEHPNELLTREQELPARPRLARPRHAVLPLDVIVGVNSHLE